jgi:phosphoribosyl-AMP cyclohydrolase
MFQADTFLNDIQWTAEGLVPAIAQDSDTGRVLMMAWMNRESLKRTAECGEAVYWSRSRQALWHKGETSGHQQKVHEIRLDCDADVIVLVVSQIGGIACHTGRESCFYRVLRDGAWQIVDPVLKDPAEIYA